MENVTVFERALEMWSDVKQYVDTVKQGKAQTPKNKSFSVVGMPYLKLKPTFSCQSLMKWPIFLSDIRQTCQCCHSWQQICFNSSSICWKDL